MKSFGESGEVMKLSIAYSVTQVRYLTLAAFKLMLLSSSSSQQQQSTLVSSPPPTPPHPFVLHPPPRWRGGGRSGGDDGRSPTTTKWIETTKKCVSINVSKFSRPVFIVVGFTDVVCDSSQSRCCHFPLISFFDTRGNRTERRVHSCSYQQVYLSIEWRRVRIVDAFVWYLFDFVIKERIASSLYKKK